MILMQAQKPLGQLTNEQAVSDSASHATSAAMMSELSAALRHGAELATALGLSLDELMQLAWSTFVDASPGLREHLAEAQLVKQLHELRTQGRVGQA